jgi:hypothetical protein
MKNLYSSAMHCNRRTFAINHLFERAIYNISFYFGLLILVGLVLISCQKESVNTPATQVQSVNTHVVTSESNVVNDYTSLSAQTRWELQQARAATAKYRNIDNAIKDGYADIEVDVENMGHHFMKSSIVDATFDITEPEILVYNKDADGKQELVAVEYAVPLSLPKPEGFTGTADVWKGDSGFPLWLVHAWVWAYNPDGAFNWTNPTVHLH